MNRLRTIVLLIALIAQALPVQAMMRVDAPQSCAMGCCAWLAEAGLSECGCEKTSEPVSPAKAPPTSGREWVLQVVWVSSEDVRFATRPAMNLENAQAHLVESALPKQPHVRLSVLFCSLLN